MDAGDTALPLSLAGLGVIAGSLVEGRVAGRCDRARVVAYAFLGGGLAAVLAFTLPVSPWLTVVLAGAVSGLLLLAWPVAAVMLTDLAGNSRATATGLFAVSNQMGSWGCVVGRRDALARAFSVGRDVLFGDGHCRGGDHAVQSPESGGGTLTALDVPISNTPALTVE